MADFKSIAITDIRPDPNQPRKFFDKASLDELTKSVKKDGVLQPIMIRPTAGNGINVKKFTIVYGERRFKAATAAGLKEIPAQIREVSDEDAFEIQINENLHRKDVHPMEEANAYMRLQKKDPATNTVKELATRFAKTEIYITQRLSFNNLVPEFQKEFYEEKFLTGHAVILSRLTKDDQYLMKKETRGQFRSVNDLQDAVDRYVTTLLSKAKFKQDDATLYPEAGPCTTCPKRSGCNQLLFPDVKEKDRCFDKKCFEIKSSLSFNIKLKKIIETRTDVYLVQARYRDANKAAVALAKEMGVKVLEEDKDFDTNNYGRFKKKATGFFVNGWDQGETKTIYLPGAATVDKNGKKVAPEKPAAEQIKDIQAREVRAKELDIEKIHMATMTKLKPIFEKRTIVLPYQPIDRGIMIFLLLEIASWRFDSDIKKLLPNFPQDKSKHGQYNEAYFESLSKVSDNDLALIIRMLVWEEYGNKTQVAGVSTDDTTIRILAKYLKVDLAAIEKEQKEIAVKRADRVKKRIADLQASKKKVNLPKPEKSQKPETQPGKKSTETKKVKSPKPKK